LGIGAITLTTSQQTDNISQPLILITNLPAIPSLASQMSGITTIFSVDLLDSHAGHQLNDELDMMK
jgi:hypothetical protein